MLAVPFTQNLILLMFIRFDEISTMNSVCALILSNGFV